MSVTVHVLKTWPEPFHELWHGAKRFEIRKNDRGFKVNDVLVLRRWRPNTERYSGRTVIARVDYIVQGRWGLPRDLCVMGLIEVSRWPRLTCPCETRNIDDPGHHLPHCRFNDPNHPDGVPW